MKELYLYTYNLNLPVIVKTEFLKNIILDELFELFVTDLLIPIQVSQKDKIQLLYTKFLFATKQKQLLKEVGIEIIENKIIIDCSGKINNFEQIQYLKQLMKKQLATLL